jgi:hypothetical protein
VVMEWMATITGDHVGYPGFQDLGDFSPKKEKNLGEQNFAPLSASNLDFFMNHLATLIYLLHVCHCCTLLNETNITS